MIALYDARYLVPPDMRLLSSGGWKMAVNRVGIPPAAMSGMERLHKEIWLHRSSPEQGGARRSHLEGHRQRRLVGLVLQRAAGRGAAQHRVACRATDIVEQGGARRWNREAHSSGIIHDIINGAPKLEMLLSPPPSSYCWLARRMGSSSRWLLRRSTSQ
jgi:hypothetical protein